MHQACFGPRVVRRTLGQLALRSRGDPTPLAGTPGGLTAALDLAFQSGSDLTRRWSSTRRQADSPPGASATHTTSSLPPYGRCST
jgi:hypothetical protein